MMLRLNQEKINPPRSCILLGAVVWLLLLLLLPNEEWRRSLNAGLVIAGTCLELWGYWLLEQFLHHQYKRATFEPFCDRQDSATEKERELNHQSLARIGPILISGLEPQGRWLHQLAMCGMVIAASGIINLIAMALRCATWLPPDLCEMTLRCVPPPEVCKSIWDVLSLGILFLLLQIVLVVTIALRIQHYGKRLGDRQGLDCSQIRQELPKLQSTFWKWLWADPGVLAWLGGGLILSPFLLLASFVYVGDVMAFVLMPLLCLLGRLPFRFLFFLQAELFKPYQAELFCTSCGQVSSDLSSQVMQKAFREQCFSEQLIECTPEQLPEGIAYKLGNLSYVGWRCDHCHPEDVLNAYYWQRLRSHDNTRCPDCHHDTIYFKSTPRREGNQHDLHCHFCHYFDSKIVPRQQRRVISSGGSVAVGYQSSYTFSEAGSGGDSGGGESGGDFGGGESGGGGGGEDW